LLTHIQSWFADAQVPFPPKKSAKSKKRRLGIVSPHIDFRVSQAAYAQAFAPLFAAPPADTYIILGVGHRARQEWSCDTRAYLTPLGRVKTHQPIIDSLLANVSSRLANDPRAHEGEHSIEFPLICLQACRQLLKINAPFTFVPILCGGLSEYLVTQTPPPLDATLYRLAGVLRQITSAAKGKVQIIVSIDGCHIGPRFGHGFAVTPDVLKDCRGWESSIWKQVTQGDLDAFLRLLMHDGNQRYFDGVGALALLLAAFGPSLTLHQTHYEQWFTPNDASVVTFTSAYFEHSLRHAPDTPHKQKRSSAK
jgi:AmmeMemoRadiSam system protein B